MEKFQTGVSVASQAHALKFSPSLAEPLDDRAGKFFRDIDVGQLHRLLKFARSSL